MPETASAVEDANLAVSLVPLYEKLVGSSVKRSPVKYGMALVCHVVVPKPPRYAMREEEALHTPESTTAMPFQAEEFWPVPPCVGPTVPERRLAPMEVVETTLPFESVESRAEVRYVRYALSEAVRLVDEAYCTVNLVVDAVPK